MFKSSYDVIVLFLSRGYICFLLLSGVLPWNCDNATNENPHVTAIRDNLHDKEISLANCGGVQLKKDSELIDNHCIFKAHFIIFGNKQYVSNIFHYKKKDMATKYNTAINNFVAQYKASHTKTSITANSALVTACKRQKRLPAGKPSGALATKRTTTFRKSSFCWRVCTS